MKVGLTDGSGNAIGSSGGALNVNATFSGTVNSSPTFAQNPAAGTPTPAYGLIDSSFRPQVSIATALPAGSAVIGHVITDTGSTTAVTGTVTVSGTVAATQSGTWNITNISGTVTLPTGASTLAEQQTQTTSLQLIDDTIVAQGTALGTTKLGLVAGSVTTNAPTFTTGQINQLSLTTAGGLRVDLKDTAANTNNLNVNLAASAATVTVSATNLSTNIAQIAGATAQSGSGTATGALRVELPTNGTGVIGAVTAITNALPAGTNAIGKLAANSGVDIGDVDVTSAVSATLDHGSNLDIDSTAEQITSTSFACKFGVTLRADLTNPGALFIGNSDVTNGSTAATDGMILYPGDSLFLPVTNSNIPYAIGAVNNNKIYWIAV
jgi:hypothetical protein